MPGRRLRIAEGNQLPISAVFVGDARLARTCAGKRVCVKWCAILLVVTASFVLAPTHATAKGNIPTHGYAVITGPGLSHPIVFVAPWKGSRGGYYNGEGERFIGFAEAIGAIPAGRLQTDSGNYAPYGVLPIDQVPSQAARGPRYRLTWFRDGVKDVAKQNIYPYAPAGPLVYTFPSSRQALIVLFGRFQAPAHLWTGWGRATSFDVQMFLRAFGLPTVAPAVRAGQANAPPSSVPADVPNADPTSGVSASAPSSGPLLPLSLSVVVILLAILVASFVWMRRHSGEKDAVSGVDA
jgi:hypothetical protein